jgi:hypothetical protein
MSVTRHQPRCGVDAGVGSRPPPAWQLPPAAHPPSSLPPLACTIQVSHALAANASLCGGAGVLNGLLPKGLLLPQLSLSACRPKDKRRPGEHCWVGSLHRCTGLPMHRRRRARQHPTPHACRPTLSSRIAHLRSLPPLPSPPPDPPPPDPPALTSGIAGGPAFSTFSVCSVFTTLRWSSWRDSATSRITCSLDLAWWRSTFTATSLPCHVPAQAGDAAAGC